MTHFWWSLQNILGLTNPSGPFYLWWSGFFADTVIFGAMIGLYYKHSCHQNGCFRIAKHSPDGTPYCTRHLGKK